MVWRRELGGKLGGRVGMLRSDIDVYVCVTWMGWVEPIVLFLFVIMA